MKIIYTYDGLHYVGGILRYFFEIISRVKREHEAIIISKYANSFYLKDLAPEAKSFLAGWSFKGKWRLESWMQNYHTHKIMRDVDFDIIHHTGDNPDIFKYHQSKPVVITIHDLIPELFFLSKQSITERKICIQKANHIICVSQNTKNDLIRFYPEIDIHKISVIYHGSEIKKYPYLPNQWGKFILYVGDRNTAYKNFIPFLQAVNILKENIQVVCTGKPFTKEEFQSIDRLSIKNQIKNLGFVDEQTLYSLYYHAVCFVYPSKYEGFGIPILEAYQNNCPICISNTSCFPEIAGDAAAYFDPEDINSISTTLKSVLYDEQLRADLIRKGKDRLVQFSWDQAAQQTCRIYQTLCEHTSLKL